MNSDDLYNAFENIDDTFAAQSEAARSGSGLGAGNNAAKQNGNRRSGQLAIRCWHGLRRHVGCGNWGADGDDGVC